MDIDDIITAIIAWTTLAIIASIELFLIIYCIIQAFNSKEGLKTRIDALTDHLDYLKYHRADAAHIEDTEIDLIMLETQLSGDRLTRMVWYPGYALGLWLGRDEYQQKWGQQLKKIEKSSGKMEKGVDVVGGCEKVDLEKGVASKLIEV